LGVAFAEALLFAEAGAFFPLVAVFLSFDLVFFSADLVCLEAGRLVPASLLLAFSFFESFSLVALSLTGAGSALF